jgi:hypothetical protein
VIKGSYENDKASVLLREHLTLDCDLILDDTLKQLKKVKLIETGLDPKIIQKH